MFNNDMHCFMFDTTSKSICVDEDICDLIYIIKNQLKMRNIKAIVVGVIKNSES